MMEVFLLGGMMDDYGVVKSWLGEILAIIDGEVNDNAFANKILLLLMSKPQPCISQHDCLFLLDCGKDGNMHLRNFVILYSTIIQPMNYNRD